MLEINIKKKMRHGFRVQSVKITKVLIRRLHDKVQQKNSSATAFSLCFPKKKGNIFDYFLKKIIFYLIYTFLNKT